MSRFLYVIAVLAIASAATGCTMFQKGTSSVVKYDNDLPPSQITAPMNASYSLYSSHDVEPKLTVQLSKGDALGFRRNENTGMVVAVAGDEEWPISGEESHYWRRR